MPLNSPDEVSAREVVSSHWVFLMGTRIARSPRVGPSNSEVEDCSWWFLNYSEVPRHHTSVICQACDPESGMLGGAPVIDVRLLTCMNELTHACAFLYREGALLSYPCSHLCRKKWCENNGFVVKNKTALTLIVDQFYSKLEVVNLCYTWWGLRRPLCISERATPWVGSFTKISGSYLADVRGLRWLVLVSGFPSPNQRTS